MGILSIPPVLSRTAGFYNTPEAALERVFAAMQAQGADIIDLGANSTRPTARIISAAEERSG